MDYIESLPDWDRVLIENVHLLDLDVLLEQIASMKPLVFCSDGGAGVLQCGPPRISFRTPRRATLEDPSENRS